MPGVFGGGQGMQPMQPNALQQFFTPQRTVAMQGLGDVLQGNNGDDFMERLQQLQQMQQMPQQTAPIPRPRPAMNMQMNRGFMAPMMGMPRRGF